MKRYDEELAELKDQLLAMSGFVEQAIDDAIEALFSHDEALAKQVAERDIEINSQEVACDHQVGDIIVRRQPAANDLRFLIGVSKIVTDLERMGDLAASIANSVTSMQGKILEPIAIIESMASYVNKQLHQAIDAFVRSDEALAREVIDKDRSVDELYKTIHREIMTYMLEDASTLSSAIVHINTAKSLERIGNHARNIAEMAVFEVTAKRLDHSGITNADKEIS
jgi:phosphate transport system protein